MKQLSRENNFYYLCVSLITILFSSAIIGQFPGTWGEDIFSLVIVFMLILSIKSLRADSVWRKSVWTLVSLLIILWVLNRTLIAPVLNDYLSLLLLFFFFAGSLKIAWKQVLFVGKVDLNRIVGSISLYLLLGLMWTIIYLSILALDPSALTGIEAGNWREAFPRAAYYSFITLTTLGYGDILPKSYLAQFFAYLEAIAGVFYMAIVVASLVSVGISEINREVHKTKKSNCEEDT